MLREAQRNFEKQLVDDNKRIDIQFLIAYFLFFVIAIVMSIVNFLTGNVLLMAMTLAFATLCIFNFALSRISSKCATVASLIFCVEFFALFVVFIITGVLDGFSTIWICMLPSFGMLFYKRLRATIICSLMFLTLAFFFWLPFGQTFLMYEYENTYMLRFPIVYLCFFLVSYILESIRIYTQRELHNTRNMYAELYIRDPLTGFFNRRGFDNLVKEIDSDKKKKDCAFMVVDIDQFKSINDTYGHTKGDKVICEVADILKEHIKCPIARWGGEEFVAYTNTGVISEKTALDICKACEKHVFDEGDLNLSVTVSVGLAFASGGTDSEELFKQADRCLYRAKNSGRNTAKFIHM